MVTSHKYYPDMQRLRRAPIKAGITSSSTAIAMPCSDALQAQAVDGEPTSMRCCEDVSRDDPAGAAGSASARCPTARIKGEGAVELGEHTRRRRVRSRRIDRAAQERRRPSAAERARMKSVAVIGPHANDVALDWYSGTPPYTMTPLDGIRNEFGRGREGRVRRQQRPAMPRCKHGKVIGRGDRRASATIPPATRHGHTALRRATARRPSTASRSPWSRKSWSSQVYAANPRTIVVLVSSFPFAINWTRATSRPSCT